MMTKRIAKKIVGGRVAGRTMATMATAHRAWWRAQYRRHRISGVMPRTAAGLAVQGGYFFTLDGRYVYLLNTDTGRWMIPVFKTEAQAKDILSHVRRLGGSVDGRRLIDDGDAFAAAVPREFNGVPLDLATNFTESKGTRLSHQTVRHDVGVAARASGVLREMRSADTFR